MESLKTDDSKVSEFYNYTEHFIKKIVHPDIYLKLNRLMSDSIKEIKDEAEQKGVNKKLIELQPLLDDYARPHMAGKEMRKLKLKIIMKKIEELYNE
jgi:hypothetical protein